MPIILVCGNCKTVLRVINDMSAWLADMKIGCCSKCDITIDRNKFEIKVEKVDSLV